MDVLSAQLRRNVPSELRELPQWVTWRYENRGGKPTKVPYQVNGELASTTDPTTWSTFEEASEAAAHGNFAGVGFVFTEADDFIGIDLDNCFADGELVEWAQEIIDRFQTYAEISPSGNGVKLFTRGVLQSGRGRRVAIGDGAIELYSWGRYFTVTGDHLVGTPKSVNAAGIDLIWLEERLPKKGPVSVPSAPPKPLESYTSGRMLAFDRACRYADKYPPAIAGQGGHDTTFRLACVLTNGFALDRYQSRQILDRYNARCEPPWSDRELEHKIDSAIAVGDREGNRGYMLAQDPVADSVDLSAILSRGAPSEEASAESDFQTEFDKHFGDLPKDESEFKRTLRMIARAHEIHHARREMEIKESAKQLRRNPNDKPAVRVLKEHFGIEDLSGRFSDGLEHVENKQTRFAGLFEALGAEKPRIYMPSRAAGMSEKDLQQPFAINGVAPRGQNVSVSGPSKACKTAIVCDLSYSLATGKPFLGRPELSVNPNPARDRRTELEREFAGDPRFQAMVLQAYDEDVRAGRVVERRFYKTLNFSGESGCRTLLSRYDQICKAHGHTLAELGDMIEFSDQLPRFGKDTPEADWLAFRATIQDHDPDFVFIDPAYLSFSDDFVKDSELGATLRRLEREVNEAGASLIVVHHFKKAYQNDQIGRWPTSEMESHRALTQWKRAWILINRASHYRPGEDHELLMTAGSSAGTGFELYVRIREFAQGNLESRSGLIAQDGSNRVWEVKEVLSRDEYDRRRQVQREEAKDQLIDEGATWLFEQLSGDVLALSAIKLRDGKPDGFGDKKIDEAIHAGLASGKYVEINRYTKGEWKPTHVTAYFHMKASPKCCEKCRSLIHKDAGCQCSRDEDEGV